MDVFENTQNPPARPFIPTKSRTPRKAMDRNGAPRVGGGMRIIIMVAATIIIVFAALVMFRMAPASVSSPPMQETTAESNDLPGFETTPGLFEVEENPAPPPGRDNQAPAQPAPPPAPEPIEPAKLGPY